MSEHPSQFYAFGPYVADARRRRLLRDGRPVALTSKAFDLLVALIERRDRVVEKDELLGLVWPEQFVEEANLSVNMSALRKALGERPGESQYILTVPRRGYRFVADVRETRGETGPAGANGGEGEARERHSQRMPAPQATTQTPPPYSPLLSSGQHLRGAFGRDVPNNLPIQLTPFVGRQSEAESVERLLLREDVRLVTLTGPGGSGKTRLAHHVAAGLLDAFPDGVYFINLDPVSDPHLVVSTVAQTLGVKEVGGTTLDESLKRHLRERALLLVLDNFEQVVSAAPVLASLLEATLRLKILVTSRAVLRLRGEHEFQVPPLLLPDLRGPFTRANELLQYASVELFVQRAVAAKSDFLLTERNAHAVAEICVQLDGLPLAIELAAARVRVLPPQAMIARLETPFKLLTGGARNLPARQQTMSGAIAWSYDLLEDAGKCLFRRLSVFVGGATLEAAEEVCGGLSGDGSDVQEGVTALVDNSLLRQVEQGGGEPRFMMLETIREYGLERLRATGDFDEARRRHAAFFLKMAEEADPELGGERLDFWLEQLEEEHDNLRAALRGSLEAGAEETALRLVRALWWFWYLHGHYEEGRAWIGRALEAGTRAQSPYRARALVGAGVLAFLQCEYAAAEEHLREGLELANRFGERQSKAMALQVLGSVARERGRYASAVARHEESLALWRELNDRRGIARSLNYIGFAAWLSGDFDEATRRCEVALQLFREQGDKEGVVWSLLNLAAVARHRGRYPEALASGEESLSLSREMSYKEGIAWSLNLTGDALRGLGREAEATAALRESLQLHNELGDRWRAASVLESLGGAAEEAGRHERAAELFASAEALREETGTPLPPVERADRERHVAALRAALGEEAFAALWARGRATPLEQAITLALTESDE